MHDPWRRAFAVLATGPGLFGWVLMGWVLLGAGGCRPSTDLTVAPPSPSAGARSSDGRAEVPPPRRDGRLPDGVAPLRYALALDIDPAAETFTGTVAVDVRIDRPTTSVVMHARDLDIERAELVEGDEDPDAAVRPLRVSYRRAAGAREAAEELVLVAPKPVPVGTATLRLAYRGPLPRDLRGVFRVVDGDHRFVFTQLEPSDARRVVPSFDDPAFKVPFDLTLTVPEGARAFANTAVASEITTPDGRRRFTFATTAPMPTYLLAFAVGPFDVLEGPQAPVSLRVLAPPGKAAAGRGALDVAAEHLPLMAEYFGVPYPFGKLDLVAVPNFAPGAMENTGLITFREELLLLGPDASATQRRDVAMIVAHELAHLWFGNLVTMRWWDDLWLNEGFATYMESEIVDRWRPEMRADLDLLGFSGRVMMLDASPSARRVRQPVANTYQAEEAFDGITYIKGARVLRMLHRWLGDDAFRTGVAAYLKRHAGGHASADDLFAALGRASGEEVARVAATFVDQTGVPLVSAELECPPNETPRVVLTAAPYQPVPTRAGSSKRWDIPVCVAFGSGASDEGRVCTLLAGDRARTTVALKGASACPAWVLPNAGYDGYYRYDLPDAQRYEALARVTPRRDVAESIGWLINAWALVQGGKQRGAPLVKTLPAYANGEDPAVMAALREVLDRVADALVTPAARSRFAGYVGRLLAPTARRLGWDARAGDTEATKRTRRAVFEALAIHGDEPWLRREAAQRGPRLLAETGRLRTETGPVALRVAARYGDVPWASLQRAYLDADDAAVRVALVQAMASAGAADDLRSTLAMVADGRIRAADATYVARVATARRDSRAVLVSWLERHLPTLAERLPGFSVGRFIGALGRVCDAAQRDAAAKTFAPVAARLGTERRLREALDGADACIDLRAREAEATSAAF
ncbi:MAG: M1 family aminopeptidase [Myxococcota bacterium]